MTARNRHHPDRVSQETKVTFCVQGVIIPPVANAASSVAHNAPVPVQQDWSNG
jgi:hypothetical protein